MDKYYQHAPFFTYSYTPNGPNFIMGSSLTTLFAEHLRLELQATNTLISNKVTTRLELPGQPVQTQEVTISYGQSKYIIVLSPSFQFNIRDIHPFAGIETGVCIPSRSLDRTGNIIGGKAGVDMDISNTVYVTFCGNYGQIAQMLTTTSSKKYSYYKLLFGVNIRLFRSQSENSRYY